MSAPTERPVCGWCQAAGHTASECPALMTFASAPVDVLTLRRDRTAWHPTNGEAA